MRPYIQVRNEDLLPNLENEAYYWKPLPMPKRTDVTPIVLISPHRRLFYHQTLNSARKSALYQPYRDVIPQDSLDFTLASVYDDKRQLLASKAEVLIQRETCGQQTARRLRNTIDVRPEVVPKLGHLLVIGKPWYFEINIRNTHTCLK